MIEILGLRVTIDSDIRILIEVVSNFDANIHVILSIDEGNLAYVVISFISVININVTNDTIKVNLISNLGTTIKVVQKILTPSKSGAKKGKRNGTSINMISFDKDYYSFYVFCYEGNISLNQHTIKISSFEGGMR